MLKQLICVYTYRHTLPARLSSRKQCKKRERAAALQFHAQLSWDTDMLPLVFIFSPKPSVSHPSLQWAWRWSQEPVQLSSQAENTTTSFGQVLFLQGCWFQVTWARCEVKQKGKQTKKRAHGVRERWEETDREPRPFKNKQEVQLFHPAILSWALKLPDTIIKEGIRGKSSRLWLETSDTKLLPQ